MNSEQTNNDPTADSSKGTGDLSESRGASNSLLRKYLQGDPILWIVFLALCVVSIIEMYSASSTLAYKAAKHTAPIMSHISFLAAGAALVFAIHLIPTQIIRMLSYPGLVISLILLILTPFIGVTENDATRWIDLFGVRFQPSELAKLSVIIVCADLISRIKDEEDEKKLFKYILGIGALACALIVTANLSTAILLFGVLVLMMFVGNISMKRILPPIFILLIVAIGFFFAVKAIPEEKMPDTFGRAYTWVARIDRFFDGTKDENKYVINDMNRQEQHGKIAVARGGIFGVLPGNSVERDYLPQAFADYIYAIIVEEMGLIGGIFVIFLYLWLLFRSGMIAQKCTTTYPAILVIGLSLMIVIQAFVSMAVSVGLGPVTGQPLPLISRGGTSIIITSLYFGIILGVTRELHKTEDKQAQVKAESENDVPIIDIEEI